ncbi:MAG: branched-chain amino acid ABC transporter permease [Clostridia bacterium]|nr:branched-chain amino acid ABC transporter permease [Clostridia bacterium]
MKNLAVTLKKVKWKHFINYIAIALVIAIFTPLSLGGSLPLTSRLLLEKIAMNILLALSLSLVVGFLGELSLGHAGFMCIGAYLGGKVALLLETNFNGDNSIVPFILALIVGAAVAGLFGFIIGLPALRLKGDYLAIVTLAFGEIVKTVFENSSEGTFGGPKGLKTPRFDNIYLFIIGFFLVLLCIFIIQNLIRSKHGRAITAIRDNEIAARAMGINVTKYKLVGFIVSAAFAGAAGVFYSFANNYVRASVFDYNYSIEILIMVVIGGMGNLTGTICSAVAVTFVNTKLQTMLTGDLAVLKDIVYALILVVIIIYNNAPALKGFREKYNFRNLLNKLFKPKSSTDKDDEGAWHRVPTKIAMDEVLSIDLKVVESTMNPDKEDKS